MEFAEHTWIPPSGHRHLSAQAIPCQPQACVCPAFLQSDYKKEAKVSTGRASPEASLLGLTSFCVPTWLSLSVSVS